MHNAGAALLRLLQIIARLRGPGGCPWDAEQTTESLKPYLLEEAYEVLEALDAGVPNAVRDELGDLLLQVAFHARIFEELQQFDMSDVANAIADKLERRHPHVFANQPCPAEQLPAQWERIKVTERASNPSKSGESPLERLPALMMARKTLEKLERQNSAYLTSISPHLLLERLSKALEHQHTSQDLSHVLGDLLLITVDLGRRLRLDAEEALRKAVKRHAINSTPDEKK
jgi:MazG family protein